MRECDYGDLNGSPATLIAERRARHIDEPFPGGQSYRQVVAGTRAFLHDLVKGWDGARVLVIAHSANRWALDCLLGGASLEGVLGEGRFAWQPGWYYTVPDGF
ncbi:histidine phosphatase family protein [Nonomuraea thailandensis]